MNAAPTTPALANDAQRGSHWQQRMVGPRRTCLDLFCCEGGAGMGYALAGYDVEICAPYLHRSKSFIARLASDLGVKANTIWTCYKPTAEGACGKCPACEKLAAAIQ